MGGDISPVDINTLATFLADEQIKILEQASPVDCIVLCGSAIFHCAESVFSALNTRPDLAKTLVICGGIGHSTSFLYDAVAKSSKYAFLQPQTRHLGEARVLELIYEHCYILKNGSQSGCKVLIEDKSTNCGANAIETRKVLDANGFPCPQTFIIVQDPTMSRRTVASFQKVYSDFNSLPVFHSCPTFVPIVQMIDGEVNYDVVGVEAEELWDTGRFLDLVLGEIPRLRDDSNGYGLRGKGFIVHVDIPSEVEQAYQRLKKVKSFRRGNHV